MKTFADLKAGDSVFLCFQPGLGTRRVSRYTVKISAVKAGVIEIRHTMDQPRTYQFRVSDGKSAAAPEDPDFPWIELTP